MTFQRARTQKQIDERKKEIISACKQIYLAEGYDLITMNKISKLTSISRASLYNYYTMKEEIMIDLLLECHLKFGNVLKATFDECETMSKAQFCEFMAKVASEQDIFWSLNSIYPLTFEKKCSQELIDNFKLKRRPLFVALHDGVRKFFPHLSQAQENEFVFLFFATINGIYPMTHLTNKQREALHKAVPWYAPPDFYKICKSAINALMHEF